MAGRLLNALLLVALFGALNGQEIEAPGGTTVVVNQAPPPAINIVTNNIIHNNIPGALTTTTTTTSDNNNNENPAVVPVEPEVTTVTTDVDLRDVEFVTPTVTVAAETPARLMATRAAPAPSASTTSTGSLLDRMAGRLRNLRELRARSTIARLFGK